MQKEEVNKLESEVNKRQVTANKGMSKQKDLFITNDREYQIYRANELKL